MTLSISAVRYYYYYSGGYALFIAVELRKFFRRIHKYRSANSQLNYGYLMIE